LFIDAEPAQIEAARKVSADAVEFHTGNTRSTSACS
jgi:pyridoxine 5'-phosphate synthase PdxJ